MKYTNKELKKMLADNNIDSRANNDVELYSCSYLMPMYWKEKTCFRQRLKDHQKKKVIQSALKQSIITTRAIHEHIQERLYTDIETGEVFTYDSMYKAMQARGHDCHCYIRQNGRIVDGHCRVVFQICCDLEKSIYGVY